MELLKHLPLVTGRVAAYVLVTGRVAAYVVVRGACPISSFGSVHNCFLESNFVYGEMAKNGNNLKQESKQPYLTLHTPMQEIRCGSLIALFSSAF